MTWACVIPDVDGLGAVPQWLTSNSAHPLTWFSEYHHILHNLAFALAVTIAGFAMAPKKWKTALFVFLAFHLHLLEDFAGSKGPDGCWSVPYLLPVSRWAYTWQGQWALNGWQNMTVTALLLAMTFWLAWARGYSQIELFSSRADAAFVSVLRARFPRTAN